MSGRRDEAPQAQERQAPSPREAQPPAPAAPSAGLSAADSLRQNWDAVLGAVKRESRVAWTLLSNASVLSLEEGILTLRFPRSGELRGFSVSGHDAVLKRVAPVAAGVGVLALIFLIIRLARR